MQLLLCCARLRLDPDERERIARLVGADLDWLKLFRLAAWHGLRPLLYRHLDAVAREAVPRAVFVELWGEFEGIARHNQALAGELEEIMRDFAQGGIRALPYKGPTLAVLVYGDVALREFGDLDILMRRGDVLRAKDVLRARGYELEYPLAQAAQAAFMESGAQYHLVMRSAERSLLVELHWKSDADFPVERMDDERWWASAREGFPLHELLLVLCLHGSKHYWSSLGWLVDVAELLRAHPEIDWKAVFARAESLGCTRRLALGLHLAHRLLDAPLAEDARRIAADEAVMALADRVAERLFEPEATTMTPIWALRFSLDSYERPWHRARFCFNVTLAPSLIEWSRWPLPRPLSFLYPPLRMGRLAVKYARRAIRRR